VGSLKLILFSEPLTEKPLISGSNWEENVGKYPDKIILLVGILFY